MFATVTIYGFGTILLALSPNFGFAIGAMAVIGASDTMSVVIRQTMVQLRTPDDMRGRVFAVNSMVTSPQISSAISAPARRPPVRHHPLGADRGMSAPSRSS